jgi:hypothetical protein
LGRTDVHFENGVLLAEGERFRRDGQIIAADVDLESAPPWALSTITVRIEAKEIPTGTFSSQWFLLATT